MKSESTNLLSFLLHISIDSMKSWHILAKSPGQLKDFLEIPRTLGGIHDFREIPNEFQEIPTTQI